MTMEFAHISFDHCSREANSVADALAKHCISMKKSEVWENIPDFIFHLFVNDLAIIWWIKFLCSKKKPPLGSYRHCKKRAERQHTTTPFIRSSSFFSKENQIPVPACPRRRSAWSGSSATRRSTSPQRIGSAINILHASSQDQEATVGCGVFQKARVFVGWREKLWAVRSNRSDEYKWIHVGRGGQNMWDEDRFKYSEKHEER